MAMQTKSRGVLAGAALLALSAAAMAVPASAARSSDQSAAPMPLASGTPVKAPVTVKPPKLEAKAVAKPSLTKSEIRMEGAEEEEVSTKPAPKVAK